MRAFVPFILFALGACGTGLDGLGSEDTDDTAITGSVVIDDLTPWWGPTIGGTLTTIIGSGFTEVEAVRVGGVEVDFFREDAETLFVTTPPNPAEGPVAVVVQTANGTATATEGFWYSDSGEPERDDPNPDPDSDTSDDPSPTGLIGGLIELSFVQVACPSCLNTAEIQLSAAAAFHQPSAVSWTDWLPAPGSCALNPNSGGPTTARMDVGEWVYLESGSSAIPMRRTNGQGGLFYEATGLTESSYLRNASFNVNVLGGAGASPFRVSGGLVSTQGFDFINPVDMLYVYPESAFAAQISQYGQTFSWGPTGGVGNFLVQIHVYDEYTGNFIGQVTCFGADNGQMTVPGGFLASFPSYSLVTVSMYRYRITETVIPSNGATLQAISQHGVIGTGTLVPY